MTGLPFDPPASTQKSIAAAIEAKRKEINTELGAGGIQQLRRDELNSALAFLSEAEKAILPGGKLNGEEYVRLSDKRIVAEIAKLKSTAALMKQSGTRIVTDGAVRTQKKQTQLSKERIEQAFKDAGIEIKRVEPLSKVLKFPNNAQKTYDSIEALGKRRLLNGTELSGITDLYSLAAFLCGEAENAALFREKSTSELKAAFDSLAIRFAGGAGDKITDLYKDIIAAGKSFVFNSEDNRKAYDNFLLYKKPELVSLFATMKGVPRQGLREPKLAEDCIRKISSVFGDYDIALAIYNKEAGLEDDPYSPEKAIFHVKCSHCQNLSEFSDLSGAQKANKCSHCGKPLYKQCGKCRKSALASLDKCPECGFVFAGAAMFAKFFAAAEQALRCSDFGEARSSLLKAQAADPGEKARCAQLEARITADEKKYEKPVNDLRRLIADRRYQKASEALAATIAGYPGLNVAAFESQIGSALKRAGDAFAAAKGLPPAGRADSCLEILHECADFGPAIDLLRATPPRPCTGFAVGLDSAGCCANISWSRSPEQGVTYRVVRKQGKDVPANEMDGETLLDGATGTSYKDSGIQPGRYCSYAAFAIRYGVFSPAVGKTVVMLADVTEARCEQFGTTVRITWNNPRNCAGVTIVRTSGGSCATLTDSANGSFEDKGVKFGVAYSYSLRANYTGFPPSGGVDVIIMPMVKIDSFSISGEQLKGNSYRVAWDIKPNAIDLRVLVDEKQVRELKSDARCCDVPLAPDGFRTISVLAYSGGAWLRSSNSLQVDTYTQCAIDKQGSRLLEDAIAGPNGPTYGISLHLKVGAPIPNGVIGFYYAVRTKPSLNEKAPWADKYEVGTAHDIHRISLPAYQIEGGINYSERAREEASYYVSLFTIYGFGGREIVSSPSMCQFSRPLTAELFWKISKSMLGGLKLTIEIAANRPFERVPELVLCACPDGRQLLSAGDPKGIRLKSIPESWDGAARRTYGNTYDLGPGLSAKQAKGLKLFLFEAAPLPNENFTLRWSRGFTGKV